MHAREPGDLIAGCTRQRQSGRRRRKPHVRHARQRGVGLRCSTDEAIEQSNGPNTRGGGDGGGVMPVERREQVTRIGVARVNGKPEELDGPDGGQQPSMGGTSRVSRELGEFGAVSGEDSPLLGPGVTTALTKWESLCHPAGSSFHTLVASSQGGASLPGAALCRYPSKVRAVNSARTDPCGGCEATRIPTATSLFVVCQPAALL